MAEPTVTHRPGLIDFDAERDRALDEDYEEHRRGRETAEAETRAWMDGAATHMGAAFLGFACGVAFAWLLDVAPAHAASMTLADGAPVASSQLRDLSAGYGPRASDWTKAPTPYAGNTAPHEGRAAGTFEDRGMGGIRGQVRVGADGAAAIVVQDLHDADTGGHLAAKIGGEWFRAEPARGENGNVRTIHFAGLREGWRSFKLYWVGDARGGRGANGAQDGYGVVTSGACR